MRAMSEIVRDLDAAVGTIDVVCSEIDVGEFDPDEVVDRLSFANTDLMVVADELRGLAGGVS